MVVVVGRVFIVSPLDSKAKTNFKTGRSGFNTNFESYLLLIWIQKHLSRIRWQFENPFYFYRFSLWQLAPFLLFPHIAAHEVDDFLDRRLIPVRSVLRIIPHFLPTGWGVYI